MGGAAISTNRTASSWRMVSVSKATGNAWVVGAASDMKHPLEQPPGDQRRCRHVLPAHEAFGGLPTREGGSAAGASMTAIVQPFPHAPRARRDIRLTGALVMNLEVAVGTVFKECLAARPEVGEPGNELLGRRGCGRLEVKGGHHVRPYIRLARRQGHRLG